MVTVNVEGVLSVAVEILKKKKNTCHYAFVKIH